MNVFIWQYMWGLLHVSFSCLAIFTYVLSESIWGNYNMATLTIKNSLLIQWINWGSRINKPANCLDYLKHVLLKSASPKMTKIWYTYFFLQFIPAEIFHRLALDGEMSVHFLKTIFKHAQATFFRSQMQKTVLVMPTLLLPLLTRWALWMWARCNIIADLILHFTFMNAASATATYKLIC